MIHEADLDEAIAQCQGEKNPNAATCYKLAAYYTIKDHLYERPQYSRDVPRTVSSRSDSEFARMIDGKSIDEVMPVIEELMETVKLLYPRLYAGVMRHLE